MELMTARLIIRPVAEADVNALLAVRKSNPERLARTEGSSGEPGRYDRGMLERDLAIAALDSNRRFLVVCDRNDGAVIGYADVLLRHPDDGHPWIGTIEIHADRQNSGIGQEVATALSGQLSRHGERIRVALDGDDAGAIAFARRCGFVQIEVRKNRLILDLIVEPAPAP